MYAAHFVSVEIHRLKKLQAAKPKKEKSGEIPWPTKIKSGSLQDAMSLAGDKKTLFFFSSKSSYLSFTLNAYDRL